MSKWCSSPMCLNHAVWKVTATNAGSHTGKTFYTCERHGMKSDDREWIGEGESPEVTT